MFLCVKPKNGPNETYLNGLDILIFSEAILVFLRIAKISAAFTCFASC